MENITIAQKQKAGVKYGVFTTQKNGFSCSSVPTGRSYKEEKPTKEWESIAIIVHPYSDVEDRSQIVFFVLKTSSHFPLQFSNESGCSY
jgi:hypothetical protein